jgi:hypothetical protein
MEIKERIKLEKIEYYDMLKSYLEYIFEGLKNGYFKYDQIQELFERLKSYKEELYEEIRYLELLLTNRDIDEEGLEQVLTQIDKSNEATYNYYEGYGDYYAAQSYTFSSMWIPDRRIPSIFKNKELTDEIVGLVLTRDDINKFFANEREALDYISKHLVILKSKQEDSYYRIYPEAEKNILQGYRLCVPKIRDLSTALINVHGYKKAIDLYPYIDKPIPLSNFDSDANEAEKSFVKDYVRNK